MTAIPAESMEDLEKLERKHAENPEGRYFVPLANAYRKIGDLDRSMELLREGLERHPDYLSAHIVLGRCLADRGDAPGAESEFRYVLSFDPQNLIALRTLGELAVAAGRTDEARDWYRDLLNVDPMNEDARRALDAVQAPREAAAGWTESADSVLDQDGTLDLEGRESVPEEASGPRTVGAVNDFETLFGSTNPDEGSDRLHGEEGDAVVTETIAELYTRQGFYDRAADVYRELIRRRGPELRLEERLREVEQLLAGGNEGIGIDAEDETGFQPFTPDLQVDSRPEIEPDPLAADSAWFRGTERSGSREERLDGDPFADSFDSGFPPMVDFDGGEQLTEEPSRRSPDEGHDTDADIDLAAPVSGGSIREYLRAVTSWRPSSAIGSASAGGQPEPDVQAETGEAPARSADDRAAPSGPPDDDLFPWELPSPLPDEPERSATPPESSTETDDRFPFEERSTTSSFEDRSSSSLSDPESFAEVEPAPSALEDLHPPAPEAAEENPLSPAPEAQQDNDDLESFQAWLRGLKR